MYRRRFRVMHTIQGMLVGIAMVLQALTPVTAADFYSAFKLYREGKFAEALVQFQELAELGSGASQFNLGAMSVRGEGMEKNAGIGVGWMLAAAENGYTQVTQEQLAKYKASLTPQQLADAEKIVAKYGRDALARRVLPGRMLMSCQHFRPSNQTQMARPYYPQSALMDGRDGIVVLEFTVGVDGLARDPHVLIAVPAGMFENPTIDALLKSRFDPAVRNDQRVESRTVTRMTYMLEDGGALWKMRAIQKVREDAEKGFPNEQYLVGLLGTLDSSLRIPADKAREMLLLSAQAGQPQAQYWVAGQLRNEQLCGNPDKLGIWLENAAKGGDAGAQVDLVRHRIAFAPDKVDADDKALLVDAATRNDAYALKHTTALFAMSPIAALQDKTLALTTAKKLASHDNNMDPHVEEAMAAAQAVNGNFREASKLQERAIKKARELYWNTASMNERLTAYKAERAPAGGDLFAVPPATDPIPDVKFELEDCSKKRGGCGRKPDKPRTPTGSLIPE